MTFQHLGAADLSGIVRSSFLEIADAGNFHTEKRIRWLLS